jgi:GTPase involved in cell partitioning and DNA repair
MGWEGGICLDDVDENTTAGGRSIQPKEGQVVVNKVEVAVTNDHSESARKKIKVARKKIEVNIEKIKADLKINRLEMEKIEREAFNMIDSSMKKTKVVTKEIEVTSEKIEANG